MPRIRSSSLEVEDFILSVSLPMSTILIFKNDLDIAQVEKYFGMKREKEAVFSKRVEFDKARLLLKWAEACNAKLLKIKNVDGRMKFYFDFNSMNDMVNFKNGLVTNVEEAMKR